MSGRPSNLNALIRVAARSAGLGQRTDLELLTELRNGDNAAFEALIRRHGPMVLQACRQVTRCEADAEDAFQSTFVLLLQKAATIRTPSVAGWLFRVARRAAGNARRSTLRCERREAKIVRRETSELPDPSWREACAILHAELDRLPDAYRLPLLLCYLQGVSRDEAARQLGWSLNTLRGRLERGRLRLRARLEKRGIGFSAGLLATLGAGHASALPSGLVRSILAASHSGAIRPLLPITWKIASALTVAAAIVVGIATQHTGLGAQPADKAKSISEPAPAKKEADAPKLAITGRVVDPDGKPVAGAKVFIRPASGKEPPATSVSSDKEGRFELPAPASRNEVITIAATADGFAAGWDFWDRQSRRELTLKLARDDVPIEGRVLDLQGKPLAGITIRVASVHAIPDGVKAYLNALGNRSRPNLDTIQGLPPGVAGEVVTDRDGRFRLTGIGRERVARLHVTGPGIAHEYIHAITVPELDTKPGSSRIYPAKFDLLTTPSRPIRGTVRDADTGKPVPGVHVRGLLSVSEATSDKDGRYELPGSKKVPRYTMYARPADGSTYFPGMAEAADPAGLDAVEIDLVIRKGIQIRGRLLDKSTGKPIEGIVRYDALANNPYVATTTVGQKAGEFFTLNVRTAADGTFTCAVLPGHGVLTIEADRDRYPPARVDPKDFNDTAGPKNTPDRLWISAGGAAVTGLSQESYQGIVLLNVDKEKPPAEQRIELTPADPIRCRIFDADGKPLSGVRIRGLRDSEDDWSQPLSGSTFTVGPLHVDRPRLLIVRHDDRKLIGRTFASYDASPPMDIRLQPWSTLTGRLVNEDGKPIARVSVFARCTIADKQIEMVRLGTVFTDAEGKFRLDGLLPELSYDLYYRGLTANARGGVLTKGVKVVAGEEREVGELRVGKKE